MNELLKGLKTVSNLTVTTNGATAYKSTMNKVYDLFAAGAAMRNSSDDDCVLLFKNAYEEDKTLALKCLFFLRDVRGGAGERRFFRVCIKWLAQKYPDEMRNLIEKVPEFGRWDDLYELAGTSLEKPMFDFISNQLALDVKSKTPSLLAKWLKSENTSSLNSRNLGVRTREALDLTPRGYRKLLSTLRQRIKIVETLMSQNRWNEIEFDKLPSRAGLIYKNAFARHDVTKARYEKFMRDENTKVNAGALYPYDVVHKVLELTHGEHFWYWRDRYDLKVPADDVNRLAINKYWDNLTDYFKGATLNALAVIDTSSSMTSTLGKSNVSPMDVAISLGLYCAERANGPFKNHFISFSSRPQLIETEGIDFCDKVIRIYRQNLCENTNIEATFDLVLNTALRNHLSQKDLPENLIVISDMQFDQATHQYRWSNDYKPTASLLENIERKWNRAGYKMPKLVFWNVNASQSNAKFAMQDKEGVTFVSGCSPVLFEQIMTGKTGQDLMLDKLLSDRYSTINSIYK